MDLGYLQSHTTPEALIGLLAYSANLIDRFVPISAPELAQQFSWEKLRKEDIYLDVSPLLAF
jgi:hypothetical protein